VSTVDSEAGETAVVRDYLGRLYAAGWGLAAARRDELVAEVSGHIDEALRGEHEAGHHGEAVVRNVLERLGPPEEIVRAESEGQRYDVVLTSGHEPFPRVWGPVEILAVVLLSVGSFLLPVVGPVAGVVFVWVSGQWTRQQKVIGSGLGLLPAALAIFLFVRI
jgi:hypothetical protein